MTVDAIIYMCIYVCWCIVVFDLFFAANIQINESVLPRRTAYFEKLLEKQMTMSRNANKNNERLIKKLFSRMQSINWLLAYLHAFKNMQKKYDGDIVAIHPLQKFNINLFERLSEKYAQRNDESKAFFAYIVYEMIPSGEEINSDYRAFNRLVRNLAVLMDSDSVYIWCNIFRAIVKMGSVKYVFYALTLLDGRIHLRNSKFFSDYLVEFKGDIHALNERLLDSLFEFSPEVQVMIINYLRLLPMSVPQENYFPKIYSALCNRGVHGETVIAAIRYFGKHRYEKAHEKLFEFLDLDIEHIKEYNYAAVSASSLSSYNSQTTIDALLRQLSSPDWYVRFNCADSLLRLDVDYEAVIAKNSDRYAKDIFIHRSEIYHMRKGAKFAQ